MDANNTLNRMASYDFKAPIDVVCLEEENSNDQIDLTSSPKSSKKNQLFDVEMVKTGNAHSDITENKKNDNNKINKRKLKFSDKNTEDCKKVAKKNIAKKTKNIESQGSKENVTECMKSISKYLTLIMESYNYYLCVLNNKKSTIHDVSLSKKNFLTIKYHFFNVAYKHVDSDILPNENDHLFVHNFLNYTSDIASKRINIDCHRGITEIYFEMVKWVKQKKYKDFSDSCNTPTLKKYLSDPPIILSTTSSEQQQKYTTNGDNSKLCIFSSGSHGRQVSINVDKSLITNENQPLNNTDQSLEKSLVLQSNTDYYQNNPLPKNNSLPIINASNPNNYYGQIQSEPMTRSNNQHVFSTNEYISERQIHYQPSPNLLRNSVIEINHGLHNTPSNAYYNYYHTTNNYQNGNYYAPNNVTQNHIVHRPQNITLNENGNLRTFRRDPHNPHRDDIREPPPPYHAPYARYPNQMMPMTQLPTVQHSFPSGPDLTRSSVSTDSGFVSPIASKTGTNTIEEIMNDLYELEKIVEPPKTTTKDPICNVCHKKAKLMCSACFKANYCNTKCQRIDWEAHKILCQAGNIAH